MNIKQLRYFLVVAEEKQITSAAKRLYIAQPPLSYQLKQLEIELGAQLFKRTAHGIELTDAGQILQSYASEILSLSESVKNQVHKTVSGELGTIAIGMASSSTGLIPMKSFQDLTKFYPEINFDIYEDNTFGIIDKLEKKTIDLGIVRTPYNRNGLNAKTLTTERMMAVTVDPKFKDKTELRIKDLNEQPLIIYRRFEEIFNQTFAHHGIKPFYAVKCDDSRTAITWAKRKMGIALVPESIASTYVPDDLIPIKHSNWITHLQLVWRKDQKVTPLMKRIIDSLSR
ncbi:LysR family transcriptional regulator [Lactobacillus helveticus]|jgi:LysR family transcriptional regulator, salicylic acid-responsive activator of bsdBCD|uniref:Transcriptional regulator n=2 Tax=Lactobacillus helveticus TaxID=1587 RepID=U4QLC1_LACHE|nr:LysR family transcriptional regulator [Lactobacillus helveticus]ADX70048.1 LysR family transcriptional regulator [Lactobacillus helveticus H10]NRN72707.1 HTH-type transcriptional regulator BenM [Lactobacillus helveticus]NRN75000.1 HTH-type transcriptional regulator BenM [Lactobacillus helveticus]NRN77034.1 HTH-type transcriptional regulator BenM [Lactobacillus helveticus]NRN77983.1 HTH-type transcriptional regulator BenM [Lactobacillus helveticus]